MIQESLQWLFTEGYHLFVTLPKQEATSWWLSVLFGGVGVSIVAATLTTLAKILRLMGRLIFTAARSLIRILTEQAIVKQPQMPVLPLLPQPLQTGSTETNIHQFASELKLISPTPEEISKIERSKSIVPIEYVGKTFSHEEGVFYCLADIDAEISMSPLASRRVSLTFMGTLYYVLIALSAFVVWFFLLK
jgi:hypothetical protein